MSNTCRIGIGGPVGSGKTALIEAITPRLLEMGYKVLVITNDVVTTEDAKHVRKMLRGVLVEERIIGVETGACPHTAVREDPSMNIAAVEEMEARFPDGDVVLIESGGDNLTLTFSPALVDFFIYVIDVAAGDKIPRKDGPGISQSDILVINKTDLAPYVHADLEVMRRDSELMRPGKPFVFSAYREIILILAVITVTTYVLSDTSNTILLPALLLGYLLVRILSSNRKLTIVRFVKWVGIFAVYMIVIFGVNILAYFCDGFTGKINGSRLSDANRVCVMNSTSDGVTFHYLSDTLSKDEAMQIIYIYNKALDTRKKSFADYIDHFKPHEISPNSVGVAIDVYTSKDDHTNLDFIDVSFEVTNAEVDNVTEKLKSLSFVEPEQTSYAY